MGTALTKCYRCGALYKEGIWYYGRYDCGTAGQFTAHGRIRDGDCPMCRKPPKTELDPVSTMVM